MLMNLAGNAIKFTPEGGRIELAAHESNGQIRVEVRDNGPWNSTRRTKPYFPGILSPAAPGAAIEGTGLGLAITQRLAELHGSTLGLESQSGQGSCFYFSLSLVRHFDSHNQRKLKLGRESVRRQRFWLIETIAMQPCSFRQTSPPQDTNPSCATARKMPSRWSRK